MQEVVGQLRAVESCVLFQGQLLQQAAAVSAGTGYSSSNFAYSSTPFSSWLKVGVAATEVFAAYAFGLPLARPIAMSHEWGTWNPHACV